MSRTRFLLGPVLLIVAALLVTLAAYCTQPTVTTTVSEAPTRAPLTIVAASPTVYVFPTMTPVPSPEAILSTPRPTATATPTSTATPTPEPPTATPVRTPVQRG